MKEIIDFQRPPEGLVHAFRLDGQGGAEKIAWQEVISADCDMENLWLHFDYSDPQTQQWITDHSGLSHVAIDGLLSEDTRPHIISRANNLLIILRGLNLNPGADPEDMVSLRIWTDGKRLISTRKRKLLSTDDIITRIEGGIGSKNITELMIQWVDRIVRRMSNFVDELEDSLLECEDQLFTNDPRDVRSVLLQLRKQSIGIRRYIAPQREALNQLIVEPITWLTDIQRINLRSIADRQIRHIEDIDAVKERASMDQEELLSRLSEEMNSRSYVLTIVAAIFLPLGFFTGLMGINVGGMPGIDSPQAFWVVSAICIGIIGILLGVFLARKWL